jgi:hypothetical protein
MASFMPPAARETVDAALRTAAAELGMGVNRSHVNAGMADSAAHSIDVSPIAAAAVASDGGPAAGSGAAGAGWQVSFGPDLRLTVPPPAIPELVPHPVFFQLPQVCALWLLPLLLAQACCACVSSPGCMHSSIEFGDHLSGQRLTSVRSGTSNSW